MQYSLTINGENFKIRAEKYSNGGISVNIEPKEAGIKDIDKLITELNKEQEILEQTVDVVKAGLCENLTLKSVQDYVAKKFNGGGEIEEKND